MLIILKNPYMLTGLDVERTQKVVNFPDLAGSGHWFAS